MAEKVTFIVEPSEGHHDVLSVQDAFQQAIDFFNLLTDDTDNNVVWNLEMATTNSPFTCRAEPIDVRTWAGARAAVAPQVAIVRRNFVRIEQGLDFDETFPQNKIEIARRVIERNTNGIGKTTVFFGEESDPVEITHEGANRYFNEVLRPSESLHSYLFSRTSRKEYGSVEGRLLEIGTDYDAPAIHLEDSKSGRKIWCRVNSETAERLAEEIRAGDAWDRRRVRVRGVVNYDNQGKVIRVIDGAVAFISVDGFDLEKIVDASFTGGYSVGEYLDRLQENDFGN